MHIFWLYQSQRGIYGRNVLIFISITFSEKHLTAVWTVLWFCAVGTGWIGSTTANTKLKNPTKRTDRRQKNQKTGRWIGVQREWQPITAKMRRENFHCHHQKQGCIDSVAGHAQTRSHTHTNTHTAPEHLPKNLHPFFFTFFFFALIAPIHRHDILIGKRRSANSCSWRAHTRRMIARAGQLMSQDGGRTTVSVPWLVLAGRHQVPEQADGVVWSQEVWFWSDSCDLFGYSESLQRCGGKFLNTPLSKEGALNGLELWSRLWVLQGGVGGCHCTLCIKSNIMIEAQMRVWITDMLSDLLQCKKPARLVFSNRQCNTRCEYIAVYNHIGILVTLKGTDMI